MRGCSTSGCSSGQRQEGEPGDSLLLQLQPQPQQPDQRGFISSYPAPTHNRDSDQKFTFSLKGSEVGFAHML